MTDHLEGMPSYFWLTSSRLRKPLQDDVPYTTQALQQDLFRVQNAWDECQASRDRNAIYGYLSAVFDLVTWWAAEDCALARARKALRLRCLEPSDHDEPFAAIIRCTSDPAKVDKRTRSKWSRVLRYAAQYKPSSEPLATFIQRKGGINECAARFTGCPRATAAPRSNAVKDPGDPQFSSASRRRRTSRVPGPKPVRRK
jgi:hypothetical protein